MSLKETISIAVKNAMKAKQSARLATLRFLQAAIKQKEIDERIDLNDQHVLAIIEKQIKQRKESIQAFESAGRTETAESEKAELAVLQEFLPEQASAEELTGEIKQALAEIAAQGVTGAPAMGKAMAILKPKLAGRADMAQVSQLLKEALLNS